MDHLRDYDTFKRLISRLCVTFDKFANDEIVEAWWKALRPYKFDVLERSIDAFIARSTDTTRFPRPGQFKPDDAPAVLDGKDSAHERYIAEASTKNWNEFCARHPTTGPLRLKLAQASRIMASEREGSPAYAEAWQEYLALERMLGDNGRFSADY